MRDFGVYFPTSDSAIRSEIVIFYYSRVDPILGTKSAIIHMDCTFAC